MRQLRNGMAYIFIYRTRDLASLCMRYRNVHITCCDGGRNCLEAIGHRQNDVGCQRLQLGCKFNGGESHRLGHGYRCLSLDY